MASDLRLGFFGAGKMAGALAKGFIEKHLVSAAEILASDPFEPARQAFAKATGAGTTSSNVEAAQFGNVLFIAVKPPQVGELLREIGPHIGPDKVLISIAAGVTLDSMSKALDSSTRLIRVMPNTPALAGASATAYALGTSATDEDAALAHRLFSAVGLAVAVKENLLDAVTGLSGSGPAYVFLVLEALSDGGVACGLPREIATQLAAQTLLGAAKLALDTGMHPGALKDMVTSPGGTTIEGLHELEKAGVRSAFINAVRAAAEKSRKLGQ